MARDPLDGDYLDGHHTRLEDRFLTRRELLCRSGCLPLPCGVDTPDDLQRIAELFALRRFE